MATVTIDLSEDMAGKLEKIIRTENAGATDAGDHAATSLIRKVITAWVARRFDSNGDIKPDLRNEEYPIVSLVYVILVHAIEFGIHEFQLPPAEDSPSDVLLTAMYSRQLRQMIEEHGQQCVARLEVMAYPKTGRIPVLHGERRYDIFVEFGTTTDNRGCVRARITDPDQGGIP